MLLNTTYGPKQPDGDKEPMLAFILNKGDMKVRGGTKGSKSKKVIEAAKEKAAKASKEKRNNNKNYYYSPSKNNKRMTGISAAQNRNVSVASSNSYSSYRYIRINSNNL